jgi:hypothetical protein
VEILFAECKKINPNAQPFPVREINKEKITAIWEHQALSLDGKCKLDYV